MYRKRTALVLGGGGSRGAYEIGVWQALKELNIKIHMVFGASVGAINGAMVAQDDFELALKLWQEIDTTMIFDIDLKQKSILSKLGMPLVGMTLDEAVAYAREIIKNGGADTSGLKELLNKYIDERKIRSASMEYGLVAVEMPEFRPHHLYKRDIPEGMLVEYILASASCFPAVKSHIINDKQFIDGGYADNIPVNMAVKKGADSVIAVDLQSIGHVRENTFKNVRHLEIINSKWDLGNFLVFNSSNAKKLLTLGYLDAMKVFGALDGIFYAFKRHQFFHHDIEKADAAAKIFDLDPVKIYTKRSLNWELSHEIKRSRKAWNSDMDLNDLTTLKEKFSDNVLTVFAADQMVEKGVDSPFRTKIAYKIMPQVVLAAQYLVKEKLVI